MTAAARPLTPREIADVRRVIRRLRADAAIETHADDLPHAVALVEQLDVLEHHLRLEARA